MTKKKKVLGVAGIAAVALIGGTFAYFSQSTTIDNPFDTAKYGTIVTEDFNPEDGEKWEPGVEVNKDLYVDNTGDRDVVVRVKFEDYWSRDGVEFKVATGSNAMQVEQTNKTDGKVEGDKSVVHKNFVSNWETKWFFNENDGYYYYKTNLGAGQTTDLFLDSVKLDPETDMGAIGTQYYFAIAKTKPPFSAQGTIATSSNANQGTWVAVGAIQDNTKASWKVKDINELKQLEDTNPEVKKYFDDLAEGVVVEKDGKYVLNSDYSIYTAALTEPAEGTLLGYSGADYILRITVETVQATDEAVRNVFKLNDPLPNELNAWDLSKETLDTVETSTEAPSTEAP